jgi:colanic acid biosynthesis glycosyl transferase WcaI
MRVVIADYAGHPFQVELSRCLASRGHPTLHLHFAEWQAPKGALTRLSGDSPNFTVEGIRLGHTFGKRQFLRRRFLEAKQGAFFAARAAQFHPDVVVGCNMPLDAQRKLYASCAGLGTPFVFWLQDVYSQAIHHYLSAKLGLLGRVIGRYYMRLEGLLLRSSDGVIAISNKFIEPLDRWGVDRRKLRVIPNWAPLSEICPVGKDNAWARRHALQDKLVALYTGTLGLKHDPALLLDLARAGRPLGIHVVVVSEGAGVDWLAEKKQALELGNLMLLPFQPMELYSEVLGAGDILLAMIGKEAAAFSVPSKVLSYLAAGKPVVASIDGANDAANMIRTAQAGFVVAPGDSRAFCAKVFALAGDLDLRRALGRNARVFAETNFEVAAIADGFEEVFTTIVKASDHRENLTPHERV